MPSFGLQLKGVTKEPDLSPQGNKPRYYEASGHRTFFGRPIAHEGPGPEKLPENKAAFKEMT